MGYTLFYCALHRLIHKSFITRAHRARDWRGLWFSGYRSLVWSCTNSAFARLVHNFFGLYAPVICDHPQLRGMSTTLTLCLQFPHSNHHTVEAASWQNHDSSPPQSVIILHSNVCLGLSNPYISSALWRQCKSKNTAHYIPILLRGLGEAMVTNDWCIIYSLWCTSHEHLVLRHPKNILTPNTKYDNRWYIVQPISKHIPTQSLVSLSILSIIFIGWVFFSLESHLTGEPCDCFILSLIVARNYILTCMFCIVWCQQISIWNKQIESSIYLIKQVWFF